jgi:hypothetical protein
MLPGLPAGKKQSPAILPPDLQRMKSKRVARATLFYWLEFLAVNSAVASIRQRKLARQPAERQSGQKRGGIY